MPKEKYGSFKAGLELKETGKRILIGKQHVMFLKSWAPLSYLRASDS